MSKKIILCILILAGFEVNGNTFRVLVVTKGVTSSVGVLSPLQVCKPNVVIKLPKDAYISLIDDLINLYDFYGEIVVSLDSLRGGASRLASQPDIALLYSRYPSFPRAVVRQRTGLSVVFPFPYALVFKAAPYSELCIGWVLVEENDAQSTSYRIVVKDQFSDILYEQLINERKACFNLPGLARRKKNDAILYLITRNGRLSIDGARKVEIGDFITNDVSLNQNSSVVNLLSGLFCEELGLENEALCFFQSAMELAPSVQEYARILDLFRERNGI